MDDFDFPFSILTNDQNDQNDQNHSTFSMEVSFPKNVNLLRIETLFLLVSGKNFIKFVQVFVNRNGIVVTLQHEKKSANITPHRLRLLRLKEEKSRPTQGEK